MAFRWKGPEVAPGPAEAPGPARPRAAEPGGTPSPALAHVLERVLRDGKPEGKPEVLDQGSLSGQTPVFLAGQGARVHVDEFEPPPPTPRAATGEAEPVKAPLRIDHATGAFDLVLAWEMFDYCPPDRLADYGAEVRRVLRQGGYLLLFSHAKPEQEEEVPPRYRILAQDRLLREPSGRPARHRWVHPNRDLERALTGFSIQKMHLQRNQMREIVALRTGIAR